MPTKFIVRERLNSAILEIIESASQRVELVSPYLDPSEHIAKAIGRQAFKRIPISRYFRQDMEKEYEGLLPRFTKDGVVCYSVPNLHAKIYRNEKTALICSMNLTKSSAMNSEECGIYTDELSLIEEMDSFIADLKHQGKPISNPSFAKTFVRKLTTALDDLTYSGYCLRCKSILEYNPEKPLCPDCYKAWKKFGNESYTEKFCHKCGQERKTTIARPLCATCWKEG